MRAILEVKALAWAALAALFALGSAGTAALAIKALPASSTMLTTTAIPADATSTDIVTSPDLVEQGRQAFALSCSHCHGDDATGDEGPNLHHLAISNTRIAATIKKGVKGEMPTFAKKYDDQQVAAIVSYLRTLR